MDRTRYKAKVRLNPHDARVLPMLEEARAEVIRLHERVAEKDQLPALKSQLGGDPWQRIARSVGAIIHSTPGGAVLKSARAASTVTPRLYPSALVENFGVPRKRLRE